MSTESPREVELGQLALAIPCPRCGAPAGRPCGPGQMLPPHAGRTFAALEAEKATGTRTAHRDGHCARCGQYTIREGDSIALHRTATVTTISLDPSAPAMVLGHIGPGLFSLCDVCGGYLSANQECWLHVTHRRDTMPLVECLDCAQRRVAGKETNR